MAWNQAFAETGMYWYCTILYYISDNIEWWVMFYAPKVPSLPGPSTILNPKT